MDLLRRIDDAIFDARVIGVQAVANHLEYYFSIRPTAVARILLVVGTAGIVTYGMGHGDWSSVLVSSIVYSWMFLNILSRTFAIEKQMKSGTRNSERFVKYEGRVLLLWVVLMALVSALLIPDYSLGSFVFLSFATYFMAADSLPPNERYQWTKPAVNET